MSDPEAPGPNSTLERMQKALAMIEEDMEKNFETRGGFAELHKYFREGGSVPAACREGALDLMLRCIKVQRDNADIQTVVCILLGVIAECEEVTRGMIDKGAIQAVTQAMRDYMHVPSLHKCACITLRSIGRRCDALEYSNLVGRHKGIEVAVKAMESHSEDSELIGEVCNMLFKLLNTAQNVNQAVDAGAVGVLVGIVTNKNVAVQPRSDACRALTMIINGQGYLPSTYNNAEAAEAMHGPKVLAELKKCKAVHAMWETLRDPDTAEALLTTCCAFFCSLQFYQEMIVKMFEEGVMEVLLDIMARFPNNLDLQMPVCLFFSNMLARLSPKGRAIPIIKERCIDAVLQALNTHQSDPEVCYCIKALASFAVVCSADLVEKNCIPAVIKTMSTHMRDADLQFEGCDILYRTCMDKSLAPHVVEHGGIEAGYAAMRAHSRDRRVVETSTSFLKLLHTINPAWESRLVRAKAECFDNVCAVCKKNAKEAGIGGMLRCSACTTGTMYCSSVCQRAGWRDHKTTCKAHPKT
jgi:hypothetical protein